jgi:transcriptional regulator with XRE-family HTH domain
LPAAEAQGNVPAIAFARNNIAREIITRRSALGWTQKQLADAAGIRVETLCRLEKGKHTASVATIEQLDRALRAVEKKASGKRPPRG